MIIFVLLGIVNSAGVKVEGKIHKCNIRDIIEMGKIFIDDPKVQVTLNHGQFQAIPQTNGDFAFYNVPYGRYFLEVQSTNYIYTAAIIDVYSNKVGSPGISVVKYHPINRQRLVLKQQDINRKAAYSMIFEPIEKIEYFEKEQEFSIESIVKNQYFFMIAVTVGMMFLLKKMPNEDLSGAAKAPQQ